jgi:hypothetical protein
MEEEQFIQKETRPFEAIVKTPEESEAISLYFLTLHSYLLQKSDLKDNYEMLVEHYTRHPKSLLILTKNDLIRLKRIQEDIVNNKYSLFSGTIDSNDNLPEFKKEKNDIRHTILCDKIIEKKEIIESITGPINYMSREHPTIFGPIDIVVQSEDTVFIIEVKTSRADHSIIGQVMKYFIAYFILGKYYAGVVIS